MVKELLHTEETYIKGLTKMMEVRLLSSLRLDRTDCQLFVWLQRFRCTFDLCKRWHAERAMDGWPS